MSSIIAVLAGAATIVAAAIAVWHQALAPRILNPASGSESGGREITISGCIRVAKPWVHYWIAIQPSHCRGADLWWPQNHRLTIDTGGLWTLSRARLGRVDAEGDIGQTYTIGLFEVRAIAQQQFARSALRDQEMTLPKGARLVTSVDVRRVVY